MALSLPPWLPPALYWNILQTITGLTVSFTPAASPLRPLTATTTVILASALHNAMSSHFSGTRASGPVAAMCWVNVLNAIDLLVLSRASYDAQAAYIATKAEKKDQDNPQPQRTQDKLLFALQIPYNYRRINTPWQISRLPHFDPANPTYTPSRAVFLLQSGLKLAIAVLLVACLTIDPHDPHLSSVIVKLNDTPSVLLLPFRDVSPTALLTQCLFTLSFGIVTRATIVAGYTSAAVVAVLLFGADPIDWPPIAGSLSGAFSLEKLWGNCWHQTLRKPLTSNATHLARLLGIPPTSRLAHSLRVVVAFTASGIVHALMDMAFGVPLTKTGGLWFFWLQIVGFAVENAVVAAARRIGLSALLGGSRVNRIIGFVWVLGFLAWSVPIWINPILLSLWKDGTRVMSPWLGGRPGWVEL